MAISPRLFLPLPIVATTMAKKKSNELRAIGRSNSQSLGILESEMLPCEKERLARIKANVERMKAYGLEEKAKSLMKLVELNNKEKTKNKKRRKSIEDDEEYIPNVNADMEKELELSDVSLDDEEPNNDKPKSLCRKVSEMKRRDPRLLALAGAFHKRRQKLRHYGRAGFIGPSTSNLDLDTRSTSNKTSNAENTSSDKSLSVTPNDIGGSKNSDDKPKRGPTMCRDVHGRSEEERLEIILNDKGQPIGPNDRTLNEYSSFLGTVARKANILPLTVPSWKKFGTDKKDELWEYVLKHYIVPLKGRSWVLKSINDSWRCYKCNLKKNHFEPYSSDTMRLKNRPKRVPKQMFKELLAIWHSESHKKASERNKNNRLVLKEKNIMHTAGPRSFARVREDWKKKNETIRDPTPAEVFMETRKEKIKKRKDGDPRDTIINELKNSNSQPVQGGDIEGNIASIFGCKNEKRRRLRLYGRGVSCSSLKQQAFEEECKKKQQEEYEEKRQKERAELAGGLRLLISEIRHACPNFTIDEGIFGSLLTGDQSSGNVTTSHGALVRLQSSGSTHMPHHQLSTSTHRSNDQELELSEDDQDEDICQ